MEMVGMPNICLMPKKIYSIEMNDGVKSLVIPIPRKGNFKDMPLSSGFGERSFNIFDEKENVVNMNDLNGVLLCSDKYPKLEDDEVFAISHIVIKEDMVLVIGKEIKVLEV